jgi:hypothetical protein
MQSTKTVADPQLERRTKAALVLAEALESSGVPYAVTSGIDGFPDAIGRDIDLLVEERDRLAVVKATAKAFRAAGWNLANQRRLNGHYWCFAIDNASKTVCEFDLAGPLQWGSAIFADRPYPDTKTGPFAVDSYACLVKRLILPLLAGKAEKVSRLNSDGFGISETGTRASKRLQHFLGADLTARLLEAVHRRSVPDLLSLAPELRQAVLSRSIRNPWRLLSAAANRVREKLAISPFEKPLAPVVAIVGPDGVGKSTVINELRKLLPHFLPVNGVIVRHWRPSLLPPLGRLAGQEVPLAGVAHPPRRKPGRLRWVRNLYYSLDFTLGAWLKDRPLSSFNKIIIYDRCYLDMQADPLRFGLPDAKGLQSLSGLYRQPDLIVLLEDSPERIHSRKPELSVAEITNIYARWKAIGQRTRGFHCVAVYAGVPQTVDKVANLIVGSAIELLLQGSKQ